ncbi:hypothetical protein [uncultured Ruegeria sp.]|uniref:hypothetical protein n=1 Tax=uncultured Ruegeria sp. TaxID=259304 RepID=UPI0026185723|nr:hypothetical protein [uncultured Ruegeria sp.]
MNPRHFLRMSQWARNPPSKRRVQLVFGIILLCLLIFGVEYMGWWPDWATGEWTRAPR